MNRYLVVSPGYPSDDNKYNCAFVHARVKQYIERGLSVDVFFVNRRKFARPHNGEKYIYEQVGIEKGNISELAKTIGQNKYGKILIHFGYKTVVSTVIKVAGNTPIIIWFHGVDIISWKRRIYNLRLKNAVKFAAYVLLNTNQRLFLKRIAKKYADTIDFVFVSNWLMQTAQKDIWSVGRIKKAHIIPNPIDTQTFEYVQKNKEDRLKILSIRSFNSRNYANDITVKAIIELSKKPFFKELKFTICGEGRLWDATIDPLKQFDNVQLENRFFSHKEIVELHRQHGVMLMPTRQDTHGISTCEGMSSGLVAISSNNSAIPEYVPSSCAYLTDDYLNIANVIEDIYNNCDKFLEFSNNGSKYIRDKCSSEVVINEEIKLITK